MNGFQGLFFSIAGLALAFHASLASAASSQTDPDDLLDNPNSTIVQNRKFADAAAIFIETEFNTLPDFARLQTKEYDSVRSDPAISVINGKKALVRFIVERTPICSFNDKGIKCFATARRYVIVDGAAKADVLFDFTMDMNENAKPVKVDFKRWKDRSETIYDTISKTKGRKK